MRKYLLLVLIILIAAPAVFMVADYLYFHDRIYPNFYIEKVYVGGLTPEIAEKTLAGYSTDEIIRRPYHLLYGTKSIRFFPSQIGAEGKRAEAVAEAYRISRGENYFRLLYHRALRVPFVIPLSLEVRDEAKFALFMKELKKKTDRAEHSAGFVKVQPTQEAYAIQPEVIGLKLNAPKTAEDIKAAIAKGSKDIAMTIEEKQPKLKAETLKRIPHPDLLGTYTTYYGTHDSPNRIHNIKLITHTMVNDSVVEPGATYSHAKTIGEVTTAKGFREAFVIVGDELVPEAGGGACQTSTTLYNAVALADLKVLMRVPHALYFSIYPLGRDAAVYPPYPDFRFENDTKYPIIIKGYATNFSLTYWIYGEHTGKKVYFTGPAVYQLGSIKKPKTSSGSKEAEAKDKNVTIQNPFRTYVQRVVQLDGKVIKKEDIWSSYLAHGDRDQIKIRRPEPAY